MRNDDAGWMARAIRLAWRGAGLTRPNPPVGAVVVRDGERVGEGWHRRAGGPHAEVVALRQAGERAQGATLYVTLEPCSTHGRTPPCTEAILNSGVREVVMAVSDPNPAHAGRAVSLLRRRGLRVRTGVGAIEASTLLAPFACRMTQRRPYVVLKLGITLDGRIADRHGKSKWITGDAARADVQRLRRQSDAIWVGAGTVVADDPTLWPRPDQGRSPWRVVLDPHGRTAPESRIYRDAHAEQTLVGLGRTALNERGPAYRHGGARTFSVPMRGGSAPLRRVLSELYARGALQVMCEGGGALAESLLRAGMVDEVVLYMAPRVMGDPAAIGAWHGRGWALPNLPTLQFIEHVAVGDDLRIRARPLNSRPQ